MPSAGKILVIRGGAIGDFILTIPVLAALRETFPDVRLELLGYPRLAQLALAAELVHDARSIDARPLASFFAKGGPLPPELEDYFASFGVIFSYLFDPDRIFQENVLRCSKAQFITGPHRPDELGGVHATDAFLKPLVRLAIFDPSPTPRLSLPLPSGSQDALIFAPADLTAGDRPLSTHPLQLNHWFAMHPGSGSERKNWPEQNWEGLLRQLVAGTKLRFLLIGGEAEQERVQRLAAIVPTDRLRLAESLPLPQLAILLQQCGAYIGHDSGISHLAAAVGLPGLILWGETRAEVWRPRSDRIHLLSAPEGLHELSVDTVLEGIDRVFYTS